jgi:hypothetical protein
VRLVGGDYKDPDFVVINEQIVDKQGNAVRINDVTTGRYDIEIGVGSTMPINKAKLYDQMKEMYELQIVDAQAVLENSALSPAQQAKILSRTQAAQQAANAQQGLSPAPAGAPPAGGLDPAMMQQELDQITQGT